MGEMGESLKLAALAAKNLKKKQVFNNPYAPASLTQNFYLKKNSPYTSMEELITHFIH